MFDLPALEAAARLVHRPSRRRRNTPGRCWPPTGAEVWVKHENHTPTGAFKVRGGLVYMERPRRERPGAAA